MMDWRAISRAAAFGVCAANEALSRVGWNPLNPSQRLSPVGERAGVHFGVGMEGISELMQTVEAVRAGQYRGVGPHALTRCLTNMAAGEISRIWGLRGPCLASNTACATGLTSIGDAYRLIQYGEADLMVAGGCEAPISPWTMSAFSRIRALSKKYNAQPDCASRPFDSTRDGFVMSEGAGAVIIQAWPPTAEIRDRCGNDVKPLAEIIGYGRSGDAYNLVSPDLSGDGAYRSMTSALKDAKFHSLCHINCHATSTPLGDAIELAAVARLLDHLQSSAELLSPHILVNSIKGYTGHLLGAAGAIEVVYTTLALLRGQAVANQNLHTPIRSDELAGILHQNPTITAADVDRIMRVMETRLMLPEHDSLPVDLPIDFGRRVALTNSFGFGGTNSTLIIAEWKD